MSETGPSEVTRMLDAISEGNAHAARDLLPIVYDQLRALAHAQMAHERSGMTLQPTALVHEAYLRLVGNADVKWNSRGHFFGAAAQAMRRILVEAARSRKQLKRGGGRSRVDLEDGMVVFDPNDLDFEELDRVLTRLEAADPRKGQVVMLRYFAGLGVQETAEALGVSAATVKNDWAYARAWLFKELSKGAPAPEKT
jgi:RNA polymerase sigma factor (TIGR02999 family)